MTDLSMLIVAAVVLAVVIATVFSTLVSLLMVGLSLSKLAALIRTRLSSPMQENATSTISFSDMPMEILPSCKGCKACILTWLESILTLLLRFPRSR